MIATACISAAVGIVFGFALGAHSSRALLRNAMHHRVESRKMLNRAEEALAISQQNQAETISLLQEARCLTSVKLKDVRT